MDNLLIEFAKIQRRLTALEKEEGLSTSQKAKILVNSVNYVNSYSSTLRDIKEDVLLKAGTEMAYPKEIMGLLSNASLLLDEISVQQTYIRNDLWFGYISNEIPEDALVVKNGKDKGKVRTVEEIYTEIDRDLGFGHRWLTAMSESPIEALRFIDSIVKKTKDNARLQDIKDYKYLQGLGRQLEKSGVTDFNWLYKRFADGTLTGYYIADIDYGRYERDKQNFQKELIKEFGEDAVLNNSDPNIKDAWSKWSEEHETWNGTRLVPNNSIYGDNEYENLSIPQQKFYDEFIKFKAKKDSYLPTGSAELYKAIQIQNDLAQIVKGAGSISSLGTSLVDYIGSNYSIRADDTDFGDQEIITDFNGKRAQFLPIHFTRNLKNMSRLSTDAISTMMAYAAMANNYMEMDKVIGVLELGREVLNDARIGEMDRGKKVVERFKVRGKTIENKYSINTKQSNMIARLNTYFEMQIYGIQRKGTKSVNINLGKKEFHINVDKIADRLNAAQGFLALGLNPVTAIANVLVGKVQIRIEAFANEHFGLNNLAKGDMLYAQHFPAFIAQIGDRVKTNKMALFGEKYDVQIDSDKIPNDIKWHKKTWISRLLSRNSIMFMQHAGEHYLYYRTTLAMADKVKFLSPQGKMVSLFDALEVVYIDPSNKEMGANLRLKEGYKKADGTEWTEQDDYDFKTSSQRVNKLLQGQYSAQEKAAFQQTTLGTMAFMFRKWIPTSMMRRFGKNAYDADLKSWREGYYRTTGRFLGTMLSDLKHLRRAVLSEWGNMSNHEKANIRRALTELTNFAMIVLGTMLLSGTDDDDSWVQRMTYYQLLRLKTEMGALIPSPLMLQEGWRLMESPVAAANLIQQLITAVSSTLSPSDYIDLVERGRYKGYPEVYRNWMKVIPIHNSIYKGLHPEEFLMFYQVQ